MTGRGSSPKYWSQIAGNKADWRESDALLAEQYRRVHLDLITRWANIGGSRRILKTDLFAEGVDPSRAFLWEMLKTNSNILGIDLSAQVTCEARTKAEQHAPNAVAKYVNCNVRHLPFTDNSFDVIVSDSTLDHFQHKNDIVVSLLTHQQVSTLVLC
ncbi:class I SAM-dependent methyltransferase [Chloroflexota bacterium]